MMYGGFDHGPMGGPGIGGYGHGPMGGPGMGGYGHGPMGGPGMNGFGRQPMGMGPMMPPPRRHRSLLGMLLTGEVLRRMFW